MWTAGRLERASDTVASGRPMIARFLIGLAIAAAALPAASPAGADPFYAGKTITVVTSTGAGGTYDLTARLLARYMPNYLDGHPAMIVQNMPGGGHVLASNFMYGVAPKDGTTIATVNNIIPLHQVISGVGVRFDADKFSWIGSTGAKNSVAYVWHGAGIKSIADASKREAMLGASGAGSSTIVYARLLNNLLGTRFKIVTGYKSVAEIDLALTRGEVEASTGSYMSLVVDHPDWITEKKLVFIAQMGAERDKSLAAVPLLTELAGSADDRQIMKLFSTPLVLGCPFLAPPGIPAERLAALREAFTATLNDKAFRADAVKAGFSVEPMSGETLARNVSELIGTSPDIVQKAKIATRDPNGAL
jgi:tripartite-type tricarboxylate transporter receptor subunit TctC